MAASGLTAGVLYAARKVSALVTLATRTKVLDCAVFFLRRNMIAPLVKTDMHKVPQFTTRKSPTVFREAQHRPSSILKVRLPKLGTNTLYRIV
jgi:hypothetical protein